MSVSIEKARAFLKNKNRLREQRLAELHARAVSDCSAIVQMIIARYSPRQIIQWGSLLQPALFREYSDIDLAVEGVCDPERFFKMFGDAERMTDFPLDLLDIDKIDPLFANLIRQKGVVIYESPNQSTDR